MFHARSLSRTLRPNRPLLIVILLPPPTHIITLLSDAERHAKNWGCVWNRDIDRMLHDAGLEVKTLDTWHFGTTYYTVCGPGDKVQLTKEREVEKEEKLGTDPKEEHTDETGRDGRGAIVGWWKRMWVRVPSNRE